MFLKIIQPFLFLAFVLGYDCSFGQAEDLSKVKSGPAVIRAEFKTTDTIEEIQTFFWDFIIDQGSRTPLAREEKIKPKAGNLFEGSMETVTMSWVSPPIDNRAFFSMRNGRFLLIDRFIIEPGDSVRIRFDMNMGRTLFDGPDAIKYKCQFEIQAAFETYKFRQDQVLLTGKENFWGDSQRDSISFFKSQKLKSSINRSVKVLAVPESRAAFLEERLNEPIHEHPAYLVLLDYKGKLDQDFYSLLETQVLGYINYSKAYLFRMAYMETEGFRTLFNNYYLNDITETPENAADSPNYLDYLYTRNLLRSALTGIPFIDLVKYKDKTLNDIILTKYIMQNYRNMGNLEEFLLPLIHKVDDPKLSALISDLYIKQKSGAAFPSLSLTNSNKEDVSMDLYNGKYRLLNFWLPGCSACAAAYKNYLSDIEKAYSSSPDFELIHLSAEADHDRWLKKIASEKYGSKNSLHLRTDGVDDPLLRHFNIYAFPRYILLDPNGLIVKTGNFPSETGSWISLIEGLINEYQ